MKTLFILALLALVATSTAAQLDITYSQGYRQPWQLQMDPCRAFLLQQCSPVAVPFTRSQMLQASSCHEMQQQCCQQLAQISAQSRCQAICGLEQAIMQQQQLLQLQGLYEPQVEIMRMALQSLPSMCNVYVPAYCSTTPCSIATAATCAGGVCY